MARSGALLTCCAGQGSKEVLTSFGCKEASVQYRDSWTAVARYLCHLDDPNKAQYNPADVVEFGGADYLAAINRAADKYRIISEMCDWAKENRIYSFNKLVDYARANELEWFMALRITARFSCANI